MFPLEGRGAKTGGGSRSSEVQRPVSEADGPKSGVRWPTATENAPHRVEGCPGCAVRGWVSAHESWPFPGTRVNSFANTPTEGTHC